LMYGNELQVDTLLISHVMLFGKIGWRVFVVRNDKVVQRFVGSWYSWFLRELYVRSDY
jgi:hypothetical protein